MIQQFESAWWSIELPTGWVGGREDTCASFWSENGVGALQISAYYRDAVAVTDSELYDFAKDELIEGATPQDSNCGEFNGITVSFFNGQKFWRKWWLRSDSLLLYVTYSCDVTDRTVESETVNRILTTLKMTLCAA